MTMGVSIQLVASEKFWTISTGSYSTTVLTALIWLRSGYYLKNWLGSDRVIDNEVLTEGVEAWLTSGPADFFHTSI
jgi:hypothetical protein